LVVINEGQVGSFDLSFAPWFTPFENLLLDASVVQVQLKNELF
jgi:hypothetical protein